LNSERTDECLFCTIPKERDGKKSWILCRRGHCFVVINTYPYTTGHVMVVCNRHVEHVSDLSGAEGAEIVAMVARCEQAIIQAYGPDGINIGANLGRSAGAGILGHLHIHVVPRWQGDTNFMTAVGETRVISEDLAVTYERLKPYFADEAVG
jgi:ATP adenylyltransferase